MPARRAHGRGDLADAVARRIAVVHSDAESLVLQGDTGNRPELVAQLGRRLFQHRYGRRRLVVLVVCPVGRGQLESVAAGVPDAGQPDALGHVGQVAPGQYRDRTPRRQLLQRVRRARGGHGRVGIVDDVRQRAVEVEEHRRLPGGETVGEAERLQCVGQLGHAAVARSARRPRRGRRPRRRRRVRAARPGVGRVFPGRQADHQGESAVASRRDTARVIGDDDAPPCRRLQPTGRLSQGSRGDRAVESRGADADFLQLPGEWRGCDGYRRMQVEQHGVMAARVDGEGSNVGTTNHPTVVDAACLAVSAPPGSPRTAAAAQRSFGRRAGRTLAAIPGEQQDAILAERHQPRHLPFDPGGEALDVACGVVVGGDAEHQLVAVAQHRDTGAELQRGRRDRQQALHPLAPSIRSCWRGPGAWVASVTMPRCGSPVSI